MISYRTTLPGVSHWKRLRLLGLDPDGLVEVAAGVGLHAHGDTRGLCSGKCPRWSVASHPLPVIGLLCGVIL